MAHQEVCDTCDGWLALRCLRRPRRRLQLENSPQEQVTPFKGLQDKIFDAARDQKLLPLGVPRSEAKHRSSTRPTIISDPSLTSQIHPTVLIPHTLSGILSTAYIHEWQHQQFTNQCQSRIRSCGQANHFPTSPPQPGYSCRHTTYASGTPPSDGQQARFLRRLPKQPTADHWPASRTLPVYQKT